MLKVLSAACVALGLYASQASAFVYHFDRTIGAGSVTGFLETDDTLGALSFSNILDWEFTLTSSNLVGGSPRTLDSASSYVILTGNGLAASSTELTWNFNYDDFSGTRLYFLDSSNINGQLYYCLSSYYSGCFRTRGEEIGYNVQDTDAAEYVFRSGVQTVASAVPLPAGLPLLLGAIGIFGIARRRQA